MPRNRQIKPDFWADEKIGKVSPLARLLFIGIWNFCDDIGVCRANAGYLRSQILQFDDMSIKKVSDLLDELKESGRIIVAEINDETFLFVKNFAKHQQINRPSTFRFIEGATKDNVLELFNSVSPHGVLTVDSLTNVNDNVNVKDNVNVNVNGSKPTSSDFEAIYLDYPRKVGREKGIQKCLREIETFEKLEEFKIAVHNYSKSIKIKQTKHDYIKHFSTFVNSWKDWVNPDPKELSVSTNQQKNGNAVIDHYNSLMSELGGEVMT